jgi:hypothetical protein
MYRPSYSTLWKQIDMLIFASRTSPLSSLLSSELRALYIQTALGSFQLHVGLSPSTPGAPSWSLAGVGDLATKSPLSQESRISSPHSTLAVEPAVTFPSSRT